MTPLSKYPSLTLLPEGAAFLKTSSTLVVADVHLGKSAAFRAHGLPVPEGDNARDLMRLFTLARRTNAAHLVIAGDLFHSPLGMTPELQIDFASFMIALEIPLTLVTGNHDRKIFPLPPLLTSVPHLDLEENIRIIHDPEDVTGESFHISGHWHPIVKISDGGRGALKFQCFVFRHQTLVLPAFGSFTGGTPIVPRSCDRIFVPLQDAVVELPSHLI